MFKLVVDVFILGALFVPLLLAVCVAHISGMASGSLLEMGWEWQAFFLATLVMPILALRRLQWLRAPSQPPSILE